MQIEYSTNFGRNSRIMEKGNSPTAPLVPPDGGYGWIIVLSVLLQMSCVGPIMPMFGLIFGSKFEEFETSPTEKTSIFAVYLLTWNIITMFVGPLVQLQSERFVAFCGTTLAITGLVLCAFSTSTLGMMLAYGLVNGAAIGLINANGILIISKFFKKKIGLAFGLFAAGLGLGALGLPQLVKFLLQSFSGQQTILIYAAICSIGYIGAILMQDVKPLMKQITEEDFKLLQQKNTKNTENGVVKKTKLNEKDGEKDCCRDFIIFRVFCMIEWKLLSDPFFLMVAIGNSMGYCAVLSYLSSLRTICSEKGLSASQTADIISVIAFTEIFTRVFQGYIGDRACIRNTFRHSKKVMFTIMGLGMSASLVAISFSFDFVSLAICVSVCSLFTSGIFINGPLIYSECFPENLPSAIGLSNLFRGAIAILFGPTTGILNTHFGSFNAALYFIAGATTCSMGVWLVVDLASWWRSRK